MSRKHQGDPGDDTSESCEENESMVECSHIFRGIDFNKVKKAIVAKGFLKDCEQCLGNNSSNNNINKIDDFDDGSGDYEYDNSLWLCLRCGNQACGRSRGQHALKHWETPHSDCHALCVNTTLWNVWCYECDNVVNVTCKRKLLEVVDFLKNKSQNLNKKQLEEGTTNNWALEVIKTTDRDQAKEDQSVCSILTLPRPRGLTNLGNTCYFNSVMQCLGQTPYLLELLQETSQPGQHFRLPGGKLNPDDKDSPVLEPLEGTLEGWKPFTETLAYTLSELQSGHASVFVPRALILKLTSKLPQFSLGDQHDAHELLRHLLEAVREDDLRRYQCVILEKLGLNMKTDPRTVEEDKKKIIKFYGQQTSELLLPTEQVFRGILVSTLQCQECQHTSHREEFFLDLSLPISEKPLPPVLRRKAEDNIDDNKQSKHQIKKEKRAERQKRRQKHERHNNNINNNNNNNNNNNLLNDSSTAMDNDDDNNKSDTESDADVEDNTEDNNVGSGNSKGIESGYNSDKIDNSSPDSNVRGISPDNVDDSGVPSPAVGMMMMMGQSQSTPDNSPASSETNIDISPLHEPDDITEDFEPRPESRLSFINNKGSDLKTDLAKLSLLNDDSNKLNNLIVSNKMEDDQWEEGAIGGIEAQEEKMEEDIDDDDDDDDDLWKSTITARYQCEDGEHSVQSCLNQFTACELMTGSNKVSCELCTKRHGGGNEKKTIYTNATKQLLIYNPPAVLILHLKRFQVLRFRSAKVSKMVKFPFLLDLAPFCSKRAQNLPTFEAGQTKVLYSLYGVVEHSGSIHGGHYVAYVKVREKLDPNSYRWQFLPKNQKNQNTPKGAIGEPDIPSGKWYYISDSHVSEVSESRVLNSQAYLLFYERIL